MINPDLIIRSYRRSLCLTITKDGSFVVHAPKRMSMNDIIKYISEKEKWIKSKQDEIQKKLSINRDVINYKLFLFLGKKYELKKQPGLKKIELTEDYLIVPDLDDDILIIKIKQWYVKQAKKILSERLEYFADIMQLDYASISIMNSKSRWGSCDTLRNIKLNFRLILLPHKTVDFVLIHELAHILEFNHSKDFYKIIQTVMPTYKLQQKILKEYDYCLQLFR
mgnify:CR=1 FL=1